MQEFVMLCIFDNQVSNPDSEPAIQESLFEETRSPNRQYLSEASKDARVVRRNEMKKSDRPETPRALPHSHMESRWSGRGQFGTVLGLCENDGETFRKLEELDTEGCQTKTWETLPGKRNGGWKCPAIIVQNRISEECVFFRER